MNKFYKCHLSKLVILFILFGILIICSWNNLSKTGDEYLLDDQERLLNDAIEYAKNNQNRHKPSEIEDILSSLWSVSDEQLLIDPKVIIKTIKFMSEEVDEINPELVEFVRSLIIPPVKPGSEKKLNLENSSRVDYSQTGQSRYIDQVLGERENGFFIETGAATGEPSSNSLYFELNRGWTGGLKIFYHILFCITFEKVTFFQYSIPFFQFSDSLFY